jgi:hypothetical protein
MFAASGMLAAPRLAVPPAPPTEAVGPALDPRRAGYEAMRLVLDAVADGGRDRRRVVSAGLLLGRRLARDRVVIYRPGSSGRFEASSR